MKRAYAGDETDYDPGGCYYNGWADGMDAEDVDEEWRPPPIRDMKPLVRQTFQAPARKTRAPIVDLVELPEVVNEVKLPLRIGPRFVKKHIRKAAKGDNGLAI